MPRVVLMVTTHQLSTRDTELLHRVQAAHRLHGAARAGTPSSARHRSSDASPTESSSKPVGAISTGERAVQTPRPEALGAWALVYTRFCDRRKSDARSMRPIHAFLRYLSARPDVPQKMVEQALAALLFYFRVVEPKTASARRRVYRRWTEHWDRQARASSGGPWADPASSVGREVPANDWFSSAPRTYRPRGDA